MENPLIIRPVRGVIVVSAIFATLGLSYLLMIAFGVSDTSFPTPLFDLLVALVLWAIAFGYYIYSLTTFAFFDDGVLILKNGYKASYEPWSKYTQAYLARGLKGHRFIVLASDKVDGHIFQQTRSWQGKIPCSECLVICLSFIGNEKIGFLKKIVNEKVSEIVDLR